MPFDDNELLDFDSSTLRVGKAGDARLLLRRHGGVFRAQLVAACWLEKHRHRRTQARHTRSGEWPSAHQAGWDEAMEDVIRYLRQGDFLPGGRFFDDETKERFRA